MSQSAKKEYFQKHYVNYDQWYDDHPQEYVDQLNFVKGILPPGKGVEIGVGTGRFASAAGIEYGVDYVPEMVEKSRKRGVKAYVADASDLPFSDGFFDYAFNIVTMCFLDRPIEALMEARRVARKVITVILDRNCEYIGNIMKNRRGFYEYAVFYTGDEVIEMYRRAGMEDVEMISGYYRTSEGEEYKLVAVIGE